MLKRMWINQPSTIEPFNKLHGTLVLAHKVSLGLYRIYFLEGPVVSQVLHQSHLSDGWPEHLVNRGN